MDELSWKRKRKEKAELAVEKLEENRRDEERKKVLILLIGVVVEGACLVGDFKVT